MTQLTHHEQAAMMHLSEAWLLLDKKIVKPGPNRKADMAEATKSIHDLQGLLARQQAARADPANWRLLGYKIGTRATAPGVVGALTRTWLRIRWGGSRL
jgi:hypothetical protein